ncbi:hypothetical protein NL529_34400, partial [Klebsiella pneumoniae]|nr:hypothetical protein [Klebsiella pneumoniae]
MSDTSAAAPDPVPDPTAAESTPADGLPEAPAPQGLATPAPAGGDSVGVTGPRHLQCAFTGKAGDYFRIWIV